MSIAGYTHRLRRLPAVARLRRLLDYLRYDWAREGARMRRKQPENMFQPYCYTSMDRYPKIFAFAQDTLGAERELDLLSFGCSSGEEVFTLSRYFPKARIKGIDINARAIAAARRATPPADADRVRFDVGSSVEAERKQSYDAIFAFAVFRDDALTGGPPRCDHLLRFADFDRAMSELAARLKPTGLLFLRHAHFRFADSSIARDFDVALTLGIDPSSEPKIVYGPDDRLIPTRATTVDVAWRKRS